MTYSYYFGFFPSLGLSFPQYLFVCVFILIATFAFISFVSLKINSNFKRISTKDRILSLKHYGNIPHKKSPLVWAL